MMQCGDHIVQNMVYMLVDGKTPDTSDDGSFRCLFEETKGGLFEAHVIDDIRNGSLENIFHGKFL